MDKVSETALNLATHVLLVNQVALTEFVCPCSQVVVLFLHYLSLSQMLLCLMLHLLHPGQEHPQVLRLRLGQLVSL